ncbi:MAG TPA: tRNA 2-thiouridine(34) synthase MnmA [Candidatus Cloacimonadota bacterium]|nr:tRNA 2-thiouridine(34) synthase MnmA [Candidatus Cloacimonadota bacterium]HQL14891.1 tRNA 2-thiouridine(34) synthase MnmA [Candidatus Cloacimonadota bacterium]
MKEIHTIAVGISGGVDSAMAAKLLLEQGYKVIGLTMSIWDETQNIGTLNKSGCYGPSEAKKLKDAVAICQKLGIEHHIIKLQSAFKDNVLDYFCSTYMNGRTPNPCLICNQKIKFGLLPQTAKEQGISFDAFATGHYARIQYNENLKRYQLKTGLDKSKDQSYFLAFLSQEQLRNLIFPLGNLTKREIKKLARLSGFSELAEKQESQDFLETDDYSVLFKKGTFQKGEIVDIHNKVLGEHNGLINYTIGQRRNLGVAGQTEAYYVLEIDQTNNRLVIGPKRYLYGTICKAVNLNWVSIPAPVKPFWTKAKIRLQHEAASCRIIPLNGQKAEVHFEEPQLSITPGQGIVFYDNEIVLGGGFIEKA